MNAARNEAYLSMTGREYAAYLDTLVADAPTRFKVRSAADLMADDSIPDDPFEIPYIVEHVANPTRNQVLSADAFAGKLAPREWRVKGVQPLGAEICMVYGDSGTGKSFLIDDMAACIHLGRPWNGRAVKQGRVIKLCAEGAHDHRYRLHAQAQAFGVLVGKLPAVIDNAPDLFDAKQAGDVAKQIKAAGGCDILIIDVLSATFSGDENGSDMGLYIRHAKLIQRALGCTVWIVHHSGHANKDRARGWSGLRAAVDVEIEVSREGDLRCASVTKSKGGADGARFGFKLVPVVLGRDSAGDAYGSCKVEYTDDLPTGKVSRLGDNEQLVLNAIRKFGPMNERVQIAEVINEALIKSGTDTGAESKDDRKSMKRSMKSLERKGKCVISGEHVSLSGVIKG